MSFNPVFFAGCVVCVVVVFLILLIFGEPVVA